MLFNSQAFVFAFLPIVLALYYLAAGRHALRQWIVIAASLVFYGYWDWRFVPLLAGLTVANWLIAWAHGQKLMPGLPTLGVILNLAVLGGFKYANFAVDNMAALLGIEHQPWNIVLPLGISFFVFQKVSYLMDLRRGDKHIYGFRDFCMFVTFFPQLIAGPIVRHNEIIAQFNLSPRRPDMWENLSRGLLLFLIGAVKKAWIADTVATICNPLFHDAATRSLSAAEAWLAAGSFTLQIYFDFSGYSDMAIGLALMFGLHLPFNFNAPYRAASIRDFWRRWHMTLSRLLRDYLYIPLGGNRHGPWRQAVNVVITMLLGGLWHGANWTFVAWGGLHGMALAINGAWERAELKLPRGVGWAITLLFVILAWVLFRSPDFATAAQVLESMAGFSGIGHVKVDNAPIVILGVLAVFLLPTSQRLALDYLKPRPWLAFVAGAALVATLLQIGGPLQKEFIYFQF